MKLTRRKVLMALGGLPLTALAGMGYGRYVEPGWLRVSRCEAKVGGLGTRLRVLHLSDLHASDVVSYGMIERAVELGLQENGDMAVLTGDYITWKLFDSERYGGILKRLSAAMPCFACMGNHDGGRWAARSHGYRDFSVMRGLLEDCGIVVLNNEAVRTRVGGEGLTIAGLGDYWSEDCRPEGVLKQERRGEGPVLVLAHNPDCKDLVQGYDWDLMFCGHTHGGQLVVPLLGGRPFLPVRDGAFAEGLHGWKGRWIHVTRGVGNLHGMRINCRPEVSVLDIR